MTIQQLFNQDPAVIASRKIPHRPILLMSRIRLARNLEGFAFPGWSDARQRKQVYEICRDAIADAPQFNPSVHFSIGSLDETERQFLVERHLISRELCEGMTGSGVTINDNQDAAIMINEEDHLRIQVMSPKQGFDALWTLSDAIDNELEKRMDYAFRDHFGYLTACPTNLGTGMRASAMMHLPALVMTKQMERVIRAVNQLGIVARGSFGESSDPSGSIFQISNQQTLGESELEIIHRLNNVITTMVEQEHKARIRLFEQEGNLVIDRIFRAYGILKYCNLLSSGEAMNLLSMLRFASDIGMLPEVSRPQIDQMFMDVQPAHLQFCCGDRLDSDQRDVMRAEKLRAVLQSLPEPDPANIDFSKGWNPKDGESSQSSDRVKPDNLE
ncbi:MAG: protein arginine kinase [Puniceicoccaceae bacterium]